MTGRHVAEHLLDGAGQQRAVLAEQLPLLGVVEEGGHGARHEVPGRLVAGHDQEEEEEVELELVELLALHLGVEEHRDEVLLGLEPPVGGQLLGVAYTCMAASPESTPGDLVLGVLGADHAVGPVEDHAAVLLGDAEQLGDDEQRELGRDLLDEVGRAALAHGVDDAVGVPDDLLLEVPHHLGREALVDQAPVARVHGRVHVDHHQLLLGQLVVVHLVEERAPPGRGEVLPVPVDVDAVVVAGDGPEAAAGGGLLGVPEDGRLPAELGEPLVGHPGHEVAPVDEVDLLEAQGPPFRARRRPRPAARCLPFRAISRTCVSDHRHRPGQADRLRGTDSRQRVCSPGGRRTLPTPRPSESRTASLTYCLALRLHEGMLFLADTRTNAGVDNVGTYRKMHVLQPAADRLFVIESAGSLATTQEVLDRMAHDLAAGDATESLATVEPSVRGGAVPRAPEPRGGGRSTRTRSAEVGADGTATFILGGHVGDERPDILLVYPEGNYIRASDDRPFLQIGESKYGKFMLELAVEAHVDLVTAAKIALGVHAEHGAGQPLRRAALRHRHLLQRVAHAQPVPHRERLAAAREAAQGVGTPPPATASPSSRAITQDDLTEVDDPT